MNLKKIFQIHLDTCHRQSTKLECQSEHSSQTFILFGKTHFLITVEQLPKLQVHI